MTFDDDSVKPVHSEGEILSRVHERGRVIRRRRRAARTLMSVVVLSALFAMGAGVARTVHTTTKPPTAFNDGTASPSPSDSQGDVVSPPPGDSISPSPTDACVNSYDQNCGKFYWDPAPGPNAPMTVTMDDPNVDETHGEHLVSITVHVVDPDAPIVCHYIYWGDGPDIGTAVTLRPRFGRWETPAKERGDQALTLTHQYKNYGTYHVSFYAVSGTDCSDQTASPYGDTGSASTTVIDPVTYPLIVRPPSGTPTPSPSENPTPSESPTPTPTPSPSDSVSPSPSP